MTGQGLRISYLLILPVVLVLLFCAPNQSYNTIVGDTLEYRENEIEESRVLVVNSIEQVSDLLHGNENALLLLALHSASCPFSISLLKKLEESVVSVSGYFESIDLGARHLIAFPPLVAKLDSSNLDPSWIQTLGIDAYPSLLFFRQVEDETVVMDYLGLREDSNDIFATILHYWYRYSAGPILIMDNLPQLQLFVQEHGSGILRHVKPPLNPDYAEEEKEIIQWLMNSDEDVSDHFTLLILCQASPSESFSVLSKIVAAQRNVALFSVANCTGVAAHGDVVATLVNPLTWEFDIFRVKSSETSLREFATVATTPSVIFYDRISTGPIAFANHRKIHAVLFARMAFDRVSLRAMRSFRHACQQQRMNRDEDFICIVIPETETRILTHFGIDIWTALDDKLIHGTQVPQVLPAMLITDQRNSRFRRFYLNASDISENVTNIPKFLNDFWSQKLTPERKSSSKPARRNSHGVEIISGNDFAPIVLERPEKHTLLYLHAPTCGHCKRFSTVWNELARMVKAAKWDSFLDIVQLDASENEIVEVDIDPGFLPALYYLPSPNKTNFVQFDERDVSGESVGRLRDPIEILDWMLLQGGFDTENLLKLINEVHIGDSEVEGRE